MARSDEAGRCEATPHTAPPLAGNAAWPIVLLVSLVVMATACSSPGQSCTGARIQCSNYTADGCAHFEGCAANPGCVILDNEGDAAACDLQTTASTCATPKCVWNGGTCTDSCSMIKDANACEVATGERDANQSLLWTCKWAVCTGQPKIRFCSDYSIAACPAGCAVRTNCSYGSCP